MNKWTLRAAGHGKLPGQQWNLQHAPYVLKHLEALLKSLKK